METDENQLLNETSNGPLTEGDISSVDATVDESSTSNQDFVNAIELSSSDRDISQNTAFNTVLFEEDNAIFPSESLHGIESDAESQDAVQIVQSHNDDLSNGPDLTNNFSEELNLDNEKSTVHLTSKLAEDMEATEVPHEVAAEAEEAPKIKKVISSYEHCLVST